MPPSFIHSRRPSRSSIWTQSWLQAMRRRLNSSASRNACSAFFRSALSSEGVIFNRRRLLVPRNRLTLNSENASEKGAPPLREYYLRPCRCHREAINVP